VRAGLKPVAFLSVEPEREDDVRARLEGLHVERATRAVRIARGDRWCGEGEERRFVELFASTDPALARRAIELQREDPTRNLAALGALLGYPTCCVEAFAAQRERGDNSANRRATAERTGAPMPWRWELRNTERMIAAFFPCTYTCERAVAHARGLLACAAREEPGIESDIEAEQRGAVLYVDHDRQLALHGGIALAPRQDRARISFRGASVAASGGDTRWNAIAERIAGGDELELDRGRAVVSFRGAEIDRVSLADHEPAALWLFG
jgi:hypothetical protein